MRGANPEFSIVVGVDFSYPSRALAAGAALALGLRARLVLVHAWTPPALDMDPVAASEPTGWIQLWVDAAARELEALATDVRLQGVEVETRIVIGNPSRALGVTAEHEHADLLAVGASSRRGLHRFLGGVSRRLLPHLPCPMLVAPRECEPAHLVPAVLLVELSPTRAARSALEWVAEFAPHLPERTHVVCAHVATTSTDSSTERQEDPRGGSLSLQRWAPETLIEPLRKRRVPVELHGLPLRSRIELLELAPRLGCDWIVGGADRRARGIHRCARDVAHLLRLADRPVLVVPTRAD